MLLENYKRFKERRKRHAAGNKSQPFTDPRGPREHLGSPVRDPFSAWSEHEQDLFLSWNSRAFDQLSHEIFSSWSDRPLSVNEELLFTCGKMAEERRIKALEAAEKEQIEAASKLQESEQQFAEMRAKMARERALFEVCYKFSHFVV